MKALKIYEIQFERGGDPYDRLDVGSEEIRIVNKLSKIANELGLKDAGIEDLNKNKAIKSWWLPPRSNWNHSKGRVTIFRNPNTNYNYNFGVYVMGKMTDMRAWTDWDTLEKWQYNIDAVYESLNFERGLDPTEALRIGKKHIWKNMSAKELAMTIIDEVGNKVQSLEDDLYQAILGAGYDTMEEYQEAIMPEDSEIEYEGDKGVDAAIDRIQTVIEEEVSKYPVKKEDKEKLVSYLVTLAVEGGPYNTYVDMIKITLDPSYLKESLDFERGKDTFSSLKIGNKGILLNAFDKLDSLKEDLFGLEAFYIGPEGFRIDSRFRDESISWANDVMNELGIRHYFERKVKKSQHGDGVDFWFEFNNSYKNIISDEDSVSARYNIYRGWKYHNKKVNESLEFERGKNPKKSMQLGEEALKKKWLSLEKGDILRIKKPFFVDRENQLVFDGYSLLRYYETSMILKIERDAHEYDDGMVSFTAFHIENNYTSHNDYWIWGSVWDFEEVFELNKVNESLHFERGKDPKESMKIGKAANATEIRAPWVHPSEIIPCLEDPNKNCGVMFYMGDEFDKARVTLKYLRNNYPDVIYMGKYYNLRKDEHTNESFNFERGKNPKETIGIGAKSLLLPHRMDHIIPQDQGNAQRIGREIQSIFGKNNQELYFLGSLKELIKREEENPEMQKLSGHMDRFTNIGNFTTGAGVELIMYATPFGKVVLEYNSFGTNNIWTDFDTIINLGYIKFFDSVKESVNFERGLDPKKAMGLVVVNVKGDRGYGDYKVKLVRPYKGHDYAPGQDVWEIEYTGDTAWAGSRGYAYKYPDSHYLTLKGYWGEIDAFIEDMNESVNFERGLNPKEKLEIGNDWKRDKMYKEFKKVTDYFRENWLEDIFPEFAQKLMDLNVEIIRLDPGVEKTTWSSQTSIVTSYWKGSEGKEFEGRVEIPKIVRFDDDHKFSENEGINVLYSIIDLIQWHEYPYTK